MTEHDITTPEERRALDLEIVFSMHPEGPSPEELDAVCRLVGDACDVQEAA